MHTRWAAKARQLGFDSSAEHGWDLRKTHRGDGDNLHSYFVKQAHEVTGAQRKEGWRRGGRTPMQLLADAVETYRVEDLGRWWTWESAAEGRRQLTWSTGRRSLRVYADLDAEQTDEQVADAILACDKRLGIPGQIARTLHSLAWYPELLEAAERYGLNSAPSWLADRGQDWKDNPPDAPPRGRLDQYSGAPDSEAQHLGAPRKPRRSMLYWSRLAPSRAMPRPWNLR